MAPARRRAGNPARPAVPGRTRRGQRGDVPGWALVTAMTVALVLLVWMIAEEQLSVIVRDAFAQFQAG